MKTMEQYQLSPDFAASPYYPQPSSQPHSLQQLQPSPQPQPSPQQNIIIMATAFGSKSQHLICPHCQANICTRMVAEPNMKTHMIVVCLCVLGLCCFALIPYFLDSCLVKKHYCPSCGSYLGIAEN